METVKQIDIERFMGDWYVLGGVPTPFERGAIDPLEHYALRPDGAIDTTFSWRRQPGATPRKLTSRAFVRDPSGAVWGMQFLWPFRADYRIVHVAPDYTTTIVGRQRRDFLWIMARSPRLAGAEFAAFHSPEVELVSGFERAFPQARAVASEQEILEDDTIALVTSAGIPSDRAALGIPSEQDYVSQYCQRRGLPPIPDWNFYLAFSFFRFAAILQGVLKRALDGNASSQKAFEYGALAPLLAQMAVALIDQTPR